MPGEKHSANDVASSPVEPKQGRFHTQEQRLPPNRDSCGPPKLEQEDEDLDVLSDAGDPQHQQEFAYVDLSRIRKEVQCPICLGVIKKTRTVMECLHRFCRECIDKSMRMGNNECPACRTHCASRRSLRDDPRYDAIIAALYPDVRKFEEEELAFSEEDETRNKQIQDSIAEVVRKQTEALGGKRRPAGKDTVGSSSVSRQQRSCRNGLIRRRRRRRRNASSPEPQDSDDNNDAERIEKHSDPDEHPAEIKKRKVRRRPNAGSSHSPSSTNLSGGSFENNLVQRTEEGRGLSPGLTCTAEMLAWGRGGVRSNSRSNTSTINNGGTGLTRSARRIRLAKLVDFLRNLDENDDEYVVLQTSLNTEKVGMMGMQDSNSSDQQSAVHPGPCSKDKPSEVIDPLQNRLHVLNKEVLSGTLANCISNGDQLILAYQQKNSTESTRISSRYEV